MRLYWRPVPQVILGRLRSTLIVSVVLVVHCYLAHVATCFGLLVSFLHNCGASLLSEADAWQSLKTSNKCWKHGPMSFFVVIHHSRRKRDAIQIAPTLLFWDASHSSGGHDSCVKSAKEMVCFKGTAKPHCRKATFGKLSRLGVWVARLHTFCKFQNGISIQARLQPFKSWQKACVARPRVGSTTQQEATHSKQSWIRSVRHRPRIC